MLAEAKAEQRREIALGIAHAMMLTMLMSTVFSIIATFWHPLQFAVGFHCGGAI